MRLSLIDPFDSMNLRLDRTTGRFVNPILGFTAAIRAHNFRNKKERSGNKWRICMHHSPYIFQLYHERGGISLRDAKTSRSRKSFCKTLFNRNTLREPAGETRAGTSGSPRVSGSSFFKYEINRMKFTIHEFRELFSISIGIYSKFFVSRPIHLIIVSKYIDILKDLEICPLLLNIYI